MKLIVYHLELKSFIFKLDVINPSSKSQLRCNIEQKTNKV